MRILIQLIVKKFIRNSDDTGNPEVRKKYGMLGGVMGIICNLILFAIKFSVGIVTNSIAVISDAFNNLSDLGSSLVAITGSFFGSKSADAEHPYGHGRAEYISALIIAFLIMVFGLELFERSARGIISPAEVVLNSVSMLLLVVSVLIKLWMWRSNRYMGRRINSSILLATAKDSLNDCVATFAVITSAFLAPYVKFPIDAVAGLVVSVLILRSGISSAKDTIGRLLGRAPSDELISEIEKMVLSGKNILGMHSLLVHDYGPDRMIASVHAEVPDNLSLIEVHNTIDKIEHNIMEELGVDIVIHMDPVPDRR